MNCTQLHRKIIFLAEGSLDAESREDMLSHISGCADCSRVWEVFSETEKIISVQKNSETSAWFNAKVKQKIENLGNANTAIGMAGIRPQFVYAIVIAFAVLSAFATGYFIGNNNYQYINNSSQSFQKETNTNGNNNTQDDQYENAFSLY